MDWGRVVQTNERESKNTRDSYAELVLLLD